LGSSAFFCCALRLAAPRRRQQRGFASCARAVSCTVFRTTPLPFHPSPWIGIWLGERRSFDTESRRSETRTANNSPTDRPRRH